MTFPLAAACQTVKYNVTQFLSKASSRLVAKPPDLGEMGVHRLVGHMIGGGERGIDQVRRQWDEAAEVTARGPPG